MPAKDPGRTLLVGPHRSASPHHPLPAWKAGLVIVLTFQTNRMHPIIARLVDSQNLKANWLAGLRTAVVCVKRRVGGCEGCGLR